MSTKRVAFKHTWQGLIPVEDAAIEALSSVPINQDVLISIHQPRNIKAHRLWWALCGLVAEWSSDEGNAWTRDDVSDFFKLSLGHYRRAVDNHGKEYRFPKSISFASLPESEFRPLLSGAIEIAITHILPNVSQDTLRAEMENMLLIRN